jgi:hypothetical protein
MSDQLVAQCQTTSSTIAFSRGEMRTLSILRRNYQEGRDLFNARERVCLRFLRWLYRTGHLAP